MSIIDKLLNLQDMDISMMSLRKESRDVPARRRMAASRLTSHRNALDKLKEQHRKERAAADLLENEIESLKEQIVTFRNQQFQIKSNVEYRALEREIALTQEKIHALEDREIERMESEERLAEEITKAEKLLAAEEEEVRQDNELLDRRTAEMEREIEDLRARRATAAGEIDPQWLSRYERILKHRGDRALVCMDGYVCGGCHMHLPPQLAMNARDTSQPTLCSFCGRILYRK